MQDGFLRAAAASIPVAVADPRRNAAAVCARIDQAHRARAALLVLPERRRFSHRFRLFVHITERKAFLA